MKSFLIRDILSNSAAAAVVAAAAAAAAAASAASSTTTAATPTTTTEEPEQPIEVSNQMSINKNHTLHNRNLNQNNTTNNNHTSRSGSNNNNVYDNDTDSDDEDIECEEEEEEEDNRNDHANNNDNSINNNNANNSINMNMNNNNISNNSPLDALFQMTSSTFDALNRGEKRKDRDSDHSGTSSFGGNKQNVKKKRKSRTAFTNNQIYELERRFSLQKYLSPSDRDEIAMTLNLSNAQVITWFQNRRAKLKRDLEEKRRDIETAQLLELHKRLFESYSASLDLSIRSNYNTKQE